MVLANLLKPIAERDINVCEIQQPEVKEGQTANIALLLDPCKTRYVSNAVAAIRELPTCLAVGAVYRVLGHPTRNLSGK